MEKQPNEAWRRVKAVIDVSGARSINAFAKQIGLTRPEVLYRIQRGENGVSKALAKRINEHFPRFNVSWLTCGGEKQPEYLKFNANDRLVVLPFYADINTLKTEYYIYLPDVLTKGAEIAVFAKSDAFCNFHHNGSVLLLKRRDNFIDYGKIYLVRANGINALCEIRPAKVHGKLSLTPIETEKFGKLEIDTDSVSEIYEICGIFIV